MEDVITSVTATTPIADETVVGNGGGGVTGGLKSLRSGASPTSAGPRRPTTVEGRFFHMEFSPLRNPRSMSTISSTGIAKPRNTTSDNSASNTAAESAASAYGTAAAVKMKHLQDFLNNYPVHDHGGSRAGGTLMSSGGGGVTITGDEEDLPALIGTKRGGGAASTLRAATSTVGGATTINVLNATTAGSAAGTVNNKDATTTAARRQKMDAWLSVADKGNKKLRSENDVLEKLALMAQENSLDNDAKYEEAISTLRTQLEFAQTFRQDTSQAVQSMDDRMEGIRGLISELVTTAERRCHQEHEAVHSAFRKQLEQQRSELDRVRERGKNTTQEWKTKNMALQEQLESVMHQTQSTYERLSALQGDSQRLRVEFSAQAGDADMLQTEYRRVYTEHQKLKDRLYTLETEMSKATVRPSVSPASMTAGNNTGALRPGSRGGAVVTKLERELKEESERARGFSRQGYRPVDGGGGDISGDAARDRDYDAALRKVQIMFETEAANLKAVREGHLHTLRQRTELEVFLRQQIVKRRGEKSRLSGGEQEAFSKMSTSARVASLANERSKKDHSTNEQANAAQVLCSIEGAPVAFHADDRKDVMDQLLSTPRVLELLFGDGLAASTTPVVGQTDGDDGDISLPMRRVQSVQKPSVHEERELLALYETWKTWTERANRETFVVPPAGGPARGATR